jgi:hypothetical protein
MELREGRLRGFHSRFSTEGARLRDDCCGDGECEAPQPGVWVSTPQYKTQCPRRRLAQLPHFLEKPAFAAGTQDGAPRFGGTESDPHLSSSSVIGLTRQPLSCPGTKPALREMTVRLGTNQAALDPLAGTAAYTFSLPRTESIRAMREGYFGLGCLRA